MRSTVFPEQYDGRSQPGRYVLESTPSVRLSSWIIVLLIFGLIGGAAYLVIERAGLSAPAAETTPAETSPADTLGTAPAIPSTPSEQPVLPQGPATGPSVGAAVGTAAAPTVESTAPQKTENGATQSGPGPQGPAIAQDRSVDGLVREALAACERGEHQAALVSAEAALALKPDNAQALFAQGRAQFELKQLEAAERALVRSIDVDPANAEARNQLGLVYLEQGRSREALQAFQDAATLAPDNAAIRRNVERARERIGTDATTEPSQ